MRDRVAGMLRISAALAVCCSLFWGRGALCAGDEAEAPDVFQWTEEGAGTEGKPAPAGEGGQATAPAPENPDEQETFKWTEVPEEGTETGPAAAAEPAGEPPVEQYEAVLRENEELKNRIAEAQHLAEKTRRENEKLAAEVRDLEERIAQSAMLIRDLQQKKAETPEVDTGRMKELEERLAQAEEEKKKLLNDVQALQKAVEERRRDEEAAQRRQEEKPAAPPAPPTAAVQPGSDLFKEKEQENLLLRNKLVDIELEKRRAEEARAQIEKKLAEAEESARRAIEKKDEIEKKYSSAVSVQKEHAKTIEKLMEIMPQMEKELAETRAKAQKAEEALRAKERDMKAMETELQRREQRLSKAERMASILEKAREEVAASDDLQKRDMHYNMGVVYAKEGRFREAEAEYLKALRIDPNDAAVHYNLAILYDDEFNDKEKAAMHYRKYLKLNPGAPDADAVKGWLMAIEMNR